MRMAYVGRFAPTPSGPLHFGSLVTALASYLDARAAGGTWLLRIDDLDRPRVRPGAEERILSQLSAHALDWDGPLRRQSEHRPAYARAIEDLRRAGLTYSCTCSRAQLQGRRPPSEADEAVYPGVCREAGHPDVGAALRLRLPTGNLTYDDLSLGPQRRTSQLDIGDFVIRRRDGHASYQLACAVDEAAQGITDVVRGSDLVASTLRQIEVSRALGQPLPRYRHLPLVVDAHGRKLSKRDDATAVREETATLNLLAALRCLGQAVLQDAEHLNPATVLAHAICRWRPQDIPPDRLEMA